MKGLTIVFDDAYTGVETFARIEQVFKDDTAIVRIIRKEEAGPNPKRVAPRPDKRISALTNGMGIVN